MVTTPFGRCVTKNGSGRQGINLLPLMTTENLFVFFSNKLHVSFKKLKRKESTFSFLPVVSR